MIALRNSLKRKFVAATMLTSSTVVLLVGMVLTASEVVSSREWLTQMLTTRAQMLASNSTAALAFDNADDARLVLGSLKTDPNMLAAALYDEHGHVFATYSANASRTVIPAIPGPAGTTFLKSSLTVVTPVSHDGRVLGTLYLRTGLQALEHRLSVQLLVVFLAVFGSIIIAFAFSMWLKRLIAQPVLSLAAAAKQVSNRQDYSVRVDGAGDDELGVLARSFNDMLQQIQSREDALHASEARLRAILESALDCVITVDQTGCIVDCNPAAEELFGYGRGTAMGSNISALVQLPASPSQNGCGQACNMTGIESALKHRRTELVARNARAVEFPVEIAITRVPQIEPAVFTAFIRDITDRRRAEGEIRQLNIDLERRVAERTGELASANKELEAFSYSVAHDLRAPLRAIDGFSSALATECAPQLSPAGVRYLERVRGAARHMGQLIDDLLNLARVSRAGLIRGPVELGALGKDLAATLAQGQTGRDVTFVIAEDLSTEGDPQLLRVVIDNLFRNAWKFTSKHASARIELGCIRNGGAPVFFVRDDGAGFDMAHASMLFAPFQRLHRQTDFEGTGIGLATVHRIIQRHQGRIWAEGAVDSGAAFYFTLWEREHA